MNYYSRYLRIHTAINDGEESALNALIRDRECRKQSVEYDDNNNNNNRVSNRSINQTCRSIELK